MAFRPERLVVHELLIRVMADVSVPDGPEYVDLGVNFRQITETIHRSHIDPHLADIVRAWHALRRRAAELIERELSASLFAAPDRAPQPARGGLLGPVRPRPEAAAAADLKAARTRSAASSPNGSAGLARATSRCWPAPSAPWPGSPPRSASGTGASAAIATS